MARRGTVGKFSRLLDGRAHYRIVGRRDKFAGCDSSVNSCDEPGDRDTVKECNDFVGAVSGAVHVVLLCRRCAECDQQSGGRRPHMAAELGGLSVDDRGVVVECAPKSKNGS